MIPSVKECFKLMEKYGMLDNIRAHSVMVEKIAGIIARELRDVGIAISLEKITAGALLHDIGKTACLNTNVDHSAKGRDLCLQNHLYEIAEIVGEHVRLKNYQPNGVICEKEIVYYADKRVNHDVVVSLERRLKYLLGRYGKNKEHVCRRIRDNITMCKDVEHKLFTNLRLKPENLADRVNIQG